MTEFKARCLCNVTKQIMKEHLEALPEHQAIIILAKKAYEILSAFNTPYEQYGALTFFTTHDKKGMGFIAQNNYFLPYPYLWESKIFGMPQAFIDDNFCQMQTLMLEGKIITDFGLYITNISNRPCISIYTGKFTQSPFSRSKNTFLFLWDEPSFIDYCNRINAFVSEEEEFAFFSIYANEAQELGFLSEFMNTLTLPSLAQENPQAQADENIEENDHNFLNEQNLLLQQEWAVRRQQLIADMNKQKNIPKKAPTKKRNTKKTTKKKKAALASPNVKSQDEIFEEEFLKIKKKIHETIHQGRVTFRKLTGLVNFIVNNKILIMNMNNIQTIETAQHGSHIVLSAPNSDPLTIVKIHGKRKNISANEARTILNRVLDLIRNAQQGTH